jgi:transposase
MLAALMARQRDLHLLALLAWARLQRKPAARKLALQGQFTAHHARLMTLALEVIDLMNHQIAELDPPIGELITPLSPQMEPLSSIPSVESTAARRILAEMGTDMSRFGSDARPTARAGVCPGHDERAGRRCRGHTRNHHRDRQLVLGP